MPDVQKTVAAILVSDLHLSDNPPAYRAAEPNWFAAMARPLAELDALKSEYNCPVICGGDIFDHWRPSPRLLEFALRTLPNMWAVPGQHDLPNHQYNRRDESGYGVLCAAGKIQNLFAQEGNAPKITSSGLRLYGAPWGYTPPRLGTPRKGRFLHVAVCHRFIWTTGATYPGGDIGCYNIQAYRDCLKGYDVALFGDNHKSFCVKQDGCVIVNPGTFMRRHRDDGTPCYGLLYDDGSAELYNFDTNRDVVVPDTTEPPTMPAMLQQELKAFVEGLAAGGSAFDFTAAVRKFVATGDLSPAAQKILLGAVGL